MRAQLPMPVRALRLMRRTPGNAWALHSADGTLDNCKQLLRLDSAGARRRAEARCTADIATLEHS